MTHPAEDAASAAARSVEWGTWLRSAAGAGITASQVNDWITLLAGVLTAVYTVLKIIEWFDARAARSEEQRTLRALWAKLDRMRSQPAPLDDQSHHEGK